MKQVTPRTFKPPHWTLQLTKKYLINCRYFDSLNKVNLFSLKNHHSLQMFSLKQIFIFFFANKLGSGVRVFTCVSVPIATITLVQVLVLSLALYDWQKSERLP
jgi:hypothetical protein